MKTAVIAFLFCALLLASAPSGFADSERWETSLWTQETPYIEKFGAKMGFGLVNILTGWTALFFEPSREKGFWNGLVRGLLFTATNTIGGVLHVATSPIPVDIPLPGGGVSFERESKVYFRE